MPSLPARALHARLGQRPNGRGGARSLLRRARREDGGATVEFVLVFPFFFAIFLMSFEASMLLARQVMLERGVDLAVRDIRLDSASTVSAADMGATVCERARILPNCQDNMMIELTIVDPETWTRPATDAPCNDLNRTILPTPRFDGDRRGQIAVVRACYAVRPFLPGGVLGARLVDDRDGAYRMLAASVFTVEP